MTASAITVEPNLSHLPVALWLSISRSELKATQNGIPLDTAEAEMLSGLLFGCLLAATTSVDDARLPKALCDDPAMADQLPGAILMHLGLAVRRAAQSGYQIHGLHKELRKFLVGSQSIISSLDRKAVEDFLALPDPTV